MFLRRMADEGFWEDYRLVYILQSRESHRLSDGLNVAFVKDVCIAMSVGYKPR